ncbi:MAG: flavodoxin family protein [archaeon]|nr:flavodoxin family protein [archaeon]
MTLKVFIVNGSPRKDFNTARLLGSFSDGVRSVCPDADIERIDLYDIDFKGCVSCFACKVKGGKSYLRCAYDDGLRGILDRMEDADIICIGSPIYFSDVTGETRCFVERLVYPHHVFTAPFPHPERERKIASAFVYTMNVTEDMAVQAGYMRTIGDLEGIVSSSLGGEKTSMCSYNTYQYTDYGRYVSDFWDVEDKERQRREQFPKDLEQAFGMGADLASRSERT